jgi:glycosyltransferase involved in cell wall biosynthesis
MQGGGAERVAALLCNAWAEEGHEVILMPTFSGRGECIYQLDPGVRLKYLSDLTGTTRKAVWISFQRLLALRQAIKSYAPDVVVSFLTRVNVVAIVAATGTGVPVIVSERIYPPLCPLPWFWSVMRRMTYPRASCLVAQTEMAREWLEEHCPGSRVKVIPNPVMWPLPINKPVMKPQDWVPPDRKLLLAVGRLHRQKGFDLLLAAFSDLVKDFPDWDLVILGEGSERRSLEAKRAALGLERHVLMPGRAGNVSSWYERADLYVMTSLYEGFPNTLLEAMAHGVPAVSFDCDAGPRDLIRHEVNGVLVPLADGVEGLVAGMRYLMRNDVLRCRMGEAACEVREKFSMGTVKDGWAVVLKLRS